MAREQRMIINYKDIVRIYGCSHTTAYKYINDVRKQLNKNKKSPVSFIEFCQHFELNLEEVKERVNVE